MFRFYFLFLTFTCFIQNGFAQDEALLQTRELGKFKKNKTTHILCERKGFVYAMGTSCKNPLYVGEFNSLFLRKYRASNLSIEDEWLIENDEDEFNGSSIRLKEVFVRRGSFFILMDVFNKRKKVRELFVKEFSFNGKQIGFKKLASVPSAYIGSREYLISFSPDSSKFMAYADINESSTDIEFPKFFVFNNSMELLYEQVPRIPGVSQAIIRPTEIKVNNQGESFILSYAGSNKDMKNDGFITMNYQISRFYKEDSVINHVLSDQGLKIHGAGLGFDQNDRPVFNGFFSSLDLEKIEGNMSVVLDNKNLDRVEVDKQLFSSKVINTLYRQTHEMLLHRSYHFYTFPDFVQHSDGMIFIAEQFNRVGGTNSSNVEIFQQSFIIIRLDAKGVFEGVSLIERDQTAAGNPEYFLAATDNKLCILFDDHLNNLEHRRKGEKVEAAYKIGAEGFSVTLANVDYEGNISYNTVISKWIFGQRPFMHLGRSAMGQNGRIYAFIFTGFSKLFLAEIDPSVNAQKTD